MNAGASNVITQGFLKGAFDVLDATLSLSFMHDVTDMNDLAPDSLAELLQQYPVTMQAKVKGDQGGVALLFATQEVLRLIALLGGKEASAKTELEDEDLATLREAAESCLGGGISHLKEKFGRDLELEEARVVRAGAEASVELQALLGEAATVATFRFSGGESIDGNAVLAFSQRLETVVPPELVNLLFGANSGTGAVAGEEADTVGGAKLSESEMGEVLSTFDRRGEPDGERGAGPRPSGHVPANIERVLDIELVVTARLGRVEMPIGDILALGPGSIIEVGHLVDEPIELLVNDKLIARGDVVVVDEKFGLRITEIVSPRERIESLG